MDMKIWILKYLIKLVKFAKLNMVLAVNVILLINALLNFTQHVDKIKFILNN